MSVTATTNVRRREIRRPRVSKAIKNLHERCGVYTKVEIVCRILNSIGWRANVDLSRACLLEPAAGDGGFIEEAVRRLVASFVRHGIQLTAKTLLPRIVAYEIHPHEAEKARVRVMKVLRAAGVHHKTAAVCARRWIITGDFLLATLPPRRYSHSAGNPPYVRWSKVPPALKKKYEAKLSPEMIGGDLFVPFLDRTFEALASNGRCGFICSDRWRFMAFAERFRKKWLPKLRIRSETTLSAAEAFTANVDSYPTILIVTVRNTARRAHVEKRSKKKAKTLGELGYIIRVGPALGHTPAFVLEPDEDDVEPELLRPWLDGSEIAEGAIKWRGRRVIVMYGRDGKLIDLNKFPRLKARLGRFKKQLKDRSVVREGAEWFQPIDRVVTEGWSKPKLLIPELAKTPRIAIDRTGKIPSHGVYAIFGNDGEIEKLYEALRYGKLARYLNGIAPKVKGGYVRCYKRFLAKIVLRRSLST